MVSQGSAGGERRPEPMSRRAVSLSRLKSASPAKRDELLSGLVSGAREPVDGYAERLDARISEFERRYEMTSAEMVERVESGALKETDDVASWLMLIKVRNRAAAAGH